MKGQARRCRAETITDMHAITIDSKARAKAHRLHEHIKHQALAGRAKSRCLLVSVW